MALTFSLSSRIPRPSRAQWATIGTTLLYIAVVVVFLVSIKHFYHRKTGFTALINFGDQFYYRTLTAVRNVPHTTYPDSWGYDGQFYAQLAVEPLLRNREIDTALDNPPYRARRILFSWTAYLLGLGQPEWILKAFALQNILAWLALAWLLARWLPPSRLRNVLPWIGCLYGTGLLGSVRLSLADGPSMLVVTLAILAHERQRHWLAASLMGLSGLGRETNMGGSLLLFDRIPRTRDELLNAAGRIALIILPFLLWSMYVRSVYPSFMYSNPASFSYPLAGYLTKWSATLTEFRVHGWASAAPLNAAVLVGLTVQAVYLATRWDWKSPWWRMAAPYCVLFVVTSYAVWTGDPGAAPRVLLPLAIAFNIQIAKLPHRWFWPLVIVGNLSVLSGISEIETPWLSTLF
ncbi:MAG: hypothetical protein NT151_00840 [Acidobacteria bacterium]|nr:hypothetical protein [Acidobacteriota bacterium]